MYTQKQKNHDKRLTHDARVLYEHAQQCADQMDARRDLNLASDSDLWLAYRDAHDEAQELFFIVSANQHRRETAYWRKIDEITSRRSFLVKLYTEYNQQLNDQMQAIRDHGIPCPARWTQPYRDLFNEARDVYFILHHINGLHADVTHISL